MNESVVNRRAFLQGALALVPAAASAWVPQNWNDAARRRGKTITHLHDGGFEGDLWGWQLTDGASVDRTVSRGGGASMRIETRKGDYARFLVLNPRVGAEYTISGWMKTAGVQPVSPGGGAFYSAPQFEFQGRPAQYTSEGHIDEQHFGNVTGNTGWRRFHRTFTCLTGTTWFEVTVGIYRAAGTAWFDDLTFVEGDHPAEPGETVEPDIAAEWAHSAVLTQIGQRRPRAAILRDDLPVRGKASDPTRLADLLRASYEVVFLKAEDLADAERFSRPSCDLLVLPYGESFPFRAVGALREYLSQGGDLLTMGGYAFQSPLVSDQGRWFFDDEHVWQEPGKNLVRLGDFAANLGELKAAGWKTSDPSCTVNPAEKTATVSIPAAMYGRSADWRFTIPAQGLAKRFSIEAELRAEEIDSSQGGFGYISLDQFDADGNTVYATPAELVRLTGTTDWQHVREMIALSPLTRHLQVRFGVASATGTLRVRDVRVQERSPEPRINTADGFPQDELQITPEQIGMFDADYRLRRTAYLAPAPDQSICRDTFRMDGDFSGYAAAGVLGMNHSRWIPLVNACDRYGRLRGAAGALMHNYAGSYARGSWAFFGVDNADLFAGGPLDDVVRALGKTLVRKCYLHELESDLACYRDGEQPRVQVKISNYGRGRQPLRVAIVILTEEGGEQVFETAQNVELAAGQTSAFAVTWPAKQFSTALYRIEARLFSGDEPIDQIRGGFAVWKEDALQAGAALTCRDNYLRLHDRPTFIQGTDDYVYMFLDRNENPLTWQAVAHACRDTCVDIYENLVGGLRGPQQNPPRQWWRWLDGLTLAVQRAGGIFMPGMLIFSDTAVSGVELDDQREFCRRFAQRYRSAPGFIYYLNGDLELHDPNLPELQKLYHEYLRSKYGSQQALEQAWAVSPPKGPLNELKIVRGTDQWSDVRTLDDYQFRVVLVRRWLGALSRAIRAVDDRHPITAEFYQYSDSGIDLLSASGDLDFGNFGYFEQPERDRRRFPAVLKCLDQGLKGKGAHVGEFGVKTHPAWKMATDYIQARTERYEQDYFLELTHTAFGQGAAKVQNWSWQYPSDLPFEWGIHYSCDHVGRDVSAYYRNSGLLLRYFRPSYAPAATVVLLPDEARKGGQGAAISEGLLNAVRLLIDARVPVSTLDDVSHQLLPSGTQAVLYPLSYCPSDAVIDHLETFVGNGGRLYLSGDISYDSLRRRTKTARLERLCGVVFESEIYAGVSFERNLAEIRGNDWPAYRGAPCIRARADQATVLASTVGGLPAVFENRLGSGRVIFSADPFELHAPVEDPCGAAFYSALIKRLSIQTERAEPADAPLHVYALDTEDHENVVVAVNYGDADLASVSVFPGGRRVTFSISAHRPGLVARDSGGGIIAIEFAGEARDENELLLRSGSHMAAMSLDRQPLLQSRRLLLLPMGTGTVQLPNAGRWRTPRAFVGTVERGHWKTLESMEPEHDGEALRLAIDEDRNLSMIVLGEAEEENALASLAERHVRRPWELRRLD